MSKALALDGKRKSGQPVRTELVQTVQVLSNILKSSLGPVGLDKMLVDDIGDIIVTNDGATILNRLEVEHPAAKMLVDLSKLQDDEVGDGTTSVVLLASELLKRANHIAQHKIHPTNIIAGYKLAARESVKFIKENMTIKTASLGPDAIMNIARTSMSSKILSSDIDHFAKICTEAVMSVKTVNDLGDYVYPVKAISVLKQHGKSSSESTLVDGFALNCTRSSQAMPTAVQNAKIALLDFDLRVTKLKLGIQIIVSDPKELEAIRRREVDVTKERILKIIAAGANVILTTKGIDDVCMKYMVEAGVIGVRRCKKDDLKRIAKATGGTILVSLASIEQDGEETFDASNLGTAAAVVEERFADDECLIVKGGLKHTQSSIILRGANSFMLDEMERSMNDALQAVKRTLESTAVCPGGGAVETALAIYLENFAHTLGSREQQAIAEFAEALLVVPKQLSINAALDAVDLVAKLRVAHHQAQSDPSQKDKGLQWTGLDLNNGVIRNSVEAGCLEPSMSKVKSIQFATEAAISILRIDDVIRLNAKEEPEQDHH
uniref:T-complex protein 1 subunit alpha n=1 Tax=Eutreptiella gymnastica TaxID=73025 RepID=A0A7S1IE80_9EUGL